jgi:tetratricopeptide (TPR) repeat protein
MSIAAIASVGVDIGTESTKVVLGSSHGCEIVRNEVGGHTTPTAISFSGRTRQIGQTANLKGNNSIIHLNRLLPGEKEELNDIFHEFYKFEHTNEEGVTVEYDSAQRSFSSSAITAMLLGNIKKSALAAVARVSGGVTPELKDIVFVLSISPGSSKEAQNQLLDAAFAAGMERTQLVPSSDCYCLAYQRKFPEQLDGRCVLIVDMGHSKTTASVVKMGVAKSANAEDGTEDKTETTVQAKIAQVLSSVRHKSLGGGSVDIRLWDHFQSTIPVLKEVTKKSRSGQRLLEGTKKLKTLLSQLPDGSVSVENVGANDSDIKLTATRDLLAELCQPDAAALTELIQKAIAEAEATDSISAIEVLGGGCRMPWVKATILNAVGNKELSLSHSLDDTSAALGAALIGENPEGYTVITSDDAIANPAERAKLFEAEQVMTKLDEDMHLKAEAKNKIEGHILEMRSAKHGTHGSLLPSSLDAYLDEMDDWLFSDEAEDASKDAMDERLQKTMEKIKEMCKDYFEAMRQESEAKEREMEEEAKKAQLERQGEEVGDEDDHDNRRLPKKRRMEIVMKNKAEANELFSDGNFKFAAARYTKALTHCAKFVDLSPDDLAEVNDLKLSLNLNLALAYLKLENPDQALRVCNEALAIDENSAKALYRRASVYFEKKNWDGAKQDAKKAACAAPEDKAIKKLHDRIDAQIKKQKDKEKKMAQKMFQ